MQIPQIKIILTQGGHQYVLTGALDTGFDGFAVVKPLVQARMGMPIVGYIEMAGFGGKQTVPVMKADSLSVQGSPACVLRDVQVAVSEFPGSEDILMGEAFFKKFAFDINYREGQPLVIACGAKVDTVASNVSDFLGSLTSQSWFWPALKIGAVGLAALTYFWLSSPPPKSEEHQS